jgi:hypothetical protein
MMTAGVELLARTPVTRPVVLTVAMAFFDDDQPTDPVRPLSSWSVMPGAMQAFARFIVVTGDLATSPSSGSDASRRTSVWTLPSG